MAKDKPQPRWQFEATGFFALRTALLPFRTLLDWADGMATPAALDGDNLAAAVACDRSELRSRLKAIAQRPEIAESLFVASPSVHAELAAWLASPDASDERLEQTVARYVQRMAGRATPFGLFAGCSVGRIGAATDIAMAGLSEYRRYSRLDNDYLARLMEHLARRQDVRTSVLYRPNSSLYRLAGRWRYVETRLGGGRRRHTLVALDADGFLDAAVARAQAGATVDALAAHVVTADPDGEITTEEATAYVLELVDRQVLVSDLSPVVTGHEAIDDLIEQLRPLAPAVDVVTTLDDVRARLAAIDRTKLGIDPARYREVEDRLSGLGVKPDPSRLFQVDMIKPAPDAVLGSAVVEEIARTVRVLHRISWVGGAESLRRFREAFVARYERREVPLFEVLDEESGIGFDRSQAPTAENVPLLQGLPFPGAADGPFGTWTSRDAFLLSRLQTVFETGGQVLDLSDADIERLANPQPRQLPDGFSVMAALIAAPDRADTNFQVLLRYAAGPAGANLLARFCHADPILQEWVQKHLAREESLRPDAVFAEIVHLPEGRMGNILARPVLRDYEITYLGRSGVPLERQVPAGDLLVSVQDDRVVLRSARLGCEVIPRLTNAHSYSRGQGVYRFLCNLQIGNAAPWVGWIWGALDSAPFLPRVVHGRSILARARWRVDKETIAAFTKGALAERVLALHRWRADNHLPRFVALADSDNELPIDFENVLSVEAFLQIVKKREAFVLFEMFPGAGALCAYGPEGQFVHEIIVPFVRQAEPSATDAPAKVRRQAIGIRRSFPPGSEWLYLKWYAGTASVDSFLIGEAPDFIRSQVESGAVDRWFFVRYSDPDWHVRLRLHGDPARLQSETLADAHRAIAPALADGSVWKVQVDTYEREIERYGGEDGILLCEEVFWRDSEAVLDILRLVPGDAGVDARWQLCLRAWDLLLADMGLTLEARHELTKENRAACGRQFRSNKTLERALGDRFRGQRKTIERLFDESAEASHPLGGALAVLRRRSQHLADVTAALRARGDAGRLSAPVKSIASNLLHMTANRMLRSAHRPQELVLYDYLDRYYESQIARARGRARRQPVGRPGVAPYHVGEPT